jgi:hypothetical protein
MKILITENQFDKVLKGLETAVNNISFNGIERISFDYDEVNDLIDVNLFFSQKLLNRIGERKFKSLQQDTNIKIFYFFRTIKLGPKFMFNIYYE